MVLEGGAYLILESLSTDVFEMWMATGRRMQLLLAHFDFNQSVGKPWFKHSKFNVTDKNSVASTREKNFQLPAAVCISETFVLKLHFKLGGGRGAIIQRGHLFEAGH